MSIKMLEKNRWGDVCIEKKGGLNCQFVIK